MNKIIYRRIPAGKPGTKKLTERYGEDLVCVRYKYDREKQIKYKTVEIIVDKGLWDPENSKKENKLVGINVGYYEFDKREKIKDAGGRWNRKKFIWELPYREVKKLGLTDRIVQIED